MSCCCKAGMGDLAFGIREGGSRGLLSRILNADSRIPASAAS